MSLAGTSRDADRDDDMKRSYVRVVIVWVVTLLGLLAFQEYFR